MSDPARSHHDESDPGGAREPDDGQRTPLWVKAFGAVGLVLLVVFVITHLAGGGFGHHTFRRLENRATTESRP